MVKEGRAANLTREDLGGIVRSVLDNGKASTNAAIVGVAPVGQIREVAGEAAQVLVCLGERVNVAPPAEVAVTALVATLKQSHALLVTVVLHVLKTDNVEHIAAQVALEVVLRGKLGVQGTREVGESIAPVVVSVAAVLAGNRLVRDGAVVGKVRRAAGVANNVTDVEVGVLGVFTGSSVAVHELSTAAVTNERDVLHARESLAVGEVVENGVQRVHRGKVGALRVGSNTAGLPGVRLTPGKGLGIVLSLVQLGGIHLGGDNDRLLPGTTVVGLLGSLKSIVHDSPVVVTIAQTAVHHHKRVLHLGVVRRGGPVHGNFFAVLADGQANELRAIRDIGGIMLHTLICAFVSLGIKLRANVQMSEAAAEEGGADLHRRLGAHNEHGGDEGQCRPESDGTADHVSGVE